MTPLDLTGLLRHFSSVIETGLFWIGWGIICAWVLPRLYERHAHRTTDHLRITAIIILVAVIFLFFLPWMPRQNGYASGWNLLLAGNGQVARYFMMLLLSFILLVASRTPILWKTAAFLTVFDSVLILLVIVTLLSNGLLFTIHGVAPLFSALLLFIADILLVLLWRQLSFTPPPIKE